jgi:hypothetical protein
MGPERASRGDTFPDKYRFTELGYILAWIIKSFGIENRQKASNKIYSIFQSNYEVERSNNYKLTKLKSFSLRVV